MFSFWFVKSSPFQIKLSLAIMQDLASEHYWEFWEKEVYCPGQNDFYSKSLLRRSNSYWTRPPETRRLREMKASKQSHAVKQPLI